MSTVATPAGALIPVDARAGLLRRFAMVCGGAAVLSLASALLQADERGPRLLEAAGYVFAVSLSTWLAIDVGRIALRRPLGAEAPDYWPGDGVRGTALVALGTVCGFFLGTWLGDQVAGQSTFALVERAPLRFYGIVTGSAAVSLASFAFFRQYAAAQVRARQAQEARMALLASQLEPHLLFNTLANLRVLIAREPARAQAMLDRLVAFLRTTLAASRSTTHPLADEFSRTSDYLELMSMRFGPRLRFELTLPDELASHPVPTLLLQPLVENAIRHGIELAVHGGVVTVWARTVRADDDCEFLELSVGDTGCGHAEAGSSPRAGLDPAAVSGGYGLAHVRQRLATLYGRNAKLRMSREDHGGTVATVTLPLTARAPLR
jgi:signal transduction histidine kinase